MLVQGGGHGIVFRRDGGSAYNTAFVEAFPEGTFIRGEGATIEEAEDAAWAKYQQYVSCPTHEWEPRGYVNGAGFCKHCNQFGSKVFTPEQLGLHCHVCGIPTYWSSAGGKFFCPDHELSVKESRELDEAAGVERGPLQRLLDAMRESQE
ncbi:hypothetical protein ASF30_12005 [Leifsonia sp. Leaf264]|nr:hypothetical protein ASF30_12005 [Leifsonia sp. Leaf264]